tara:strand:+ start:1001 stop:2587 length:1587 start_codon:yes stop_codon:yes gene_type:complete
MLRDYQQRTIDELYNWFRSGNNGHPCIVLPTGSGKSHIVAAICKDALQNWPETRVLMLTHVKELIEQNADKMREHWPNAPMGIYSSSLRSRRLNEPITFAGIQSVRNRANEIGHIDLVIIDECHLVSHKEEGGYRNLLEKLILINPNLRVIGLTATPYRLGHGLITDKPALFSDLINPVTIEELVAKGHLAPLRSKITNLTLTIDGVHKRGGEFIESELQKSVDTIHQNMGAVKEAIRLANDKKSWLFFCVGVDHAYNIRNELRENGISAETITGKTPKKEREKIIDDFKAGRITALTNANVLTTGFDYPNLDAIIMLRPTMSPSLYVQMAGRGMRPKSHTDHCMVLDFAGVVRTHGPITAVDPGRKAGTGEAPMKVCDNCNEIVHLSVKICPACGTLFPEKKLAINQKLYNDEIMGIAGKNMDVTSWTWRRHVSFNSGKEMLRVTYYGALSDKPINEYLTVQHEGYAGKKAIENFASLATKSHANMSNMKNASLVEAAETMNEATPPSIIKYKMDGKYHRVLHRSWN